jgi:polar amino acid transport system substrate-binding protein
VVVSKGNPAKITGRDLSLCGKNIAVTLGGIEESQARADNQRCLEAKKPAINVMTFPAATDSAVAVAQGRADAEFLSTPGTVALLTEKAGMFEAVGDEFEAIPTSRLPCVKAIPKPRPCWRKVSRASSKMAPTSN